MNLSHWKPPSRLPGQAEVVKKQITSQSQVTQNLQEVRLSKGKRQGAVHNSHQSVHKSRQHRQSGQNSPTTESSDQQKSQEPCGRSGKRRNFDGQCPARRAECHKCHRKGHYAHISCTRAHNVREVTEHGAARRGNSSWFLFHAEMMPNQHGKIP